MQQNPWRESSLIGHSFPCVLLAYLCFLSSIETVRAPASWVKRFTVVGATGRSARGSRKTAGLPLFHPGGGGRHDDKRQKYWWSRTSGGVVERKSEECVAFFVESCEADRTPHQHPGARGCTGTSRGAQVGRDDHHELRVTHRWSKSIDRCGAVKGSVRKRELFCGFTLGFNPIHIYLQDTIPHTTGRDMWGPPPPVLRGHSTAAGGAAAFPVYFCDEVMGINSPVSGANTR